MARARWSTCAATTAWCSPTGTWWPTPPAHVEVCFPTAFARRRGVITTDRTWDLAALAVWRPNVAPVSLATRAPQPGDPLTIAGYGSGTYRADDGHLHAICRSRQ